MTSLMDVVERLRQVKEMLVSEAPTVLVHAADFLQRLSETTRDVAEFLETLKTDKQVRMQVTGDTTTEGNKKYKTFDPEKKAAFEKAHEELEKLARECRKEAKAKVTNVKAGPSNALKHAMAGVLAHTVDQLLDEVDEL